MPHRLLHIMRDNDDGIYLFSVLSTSSSILPVEIGSSARGRLVHQQNLRLDRQARGQCRAAAAGRRKVPSALFFSRSLTSSQIAAPRKRALYNIVQASLWFVRHGCADQRRCCHKRSSGTGSASGRPSPPACAARLTSISAVDILAVEDGCSPVNPATLAQGRSYG